MNILVLGGTRFVGRHLVDAAVAGGHRVTLFNRGQSDATPRPGIQQLLGDRNGNLEALRGHRWDAVIDTSGYVPPIVRRSVELLASAVGHYTFISTVSVYASGRSEERVDENAPLLTLEDEAREDIEDPKIYGALKVLCERAVEGLMPGRTLVPRLSLVVGPLDPTDRFTYWPRRIARGGPILAFDHSDRVVHPFIDARDAARWIDASVEAGRSGTFNVGGRVGMTIGEVLETCRSVSGVGDASFVWVSEAFLPEHDVKGWTELLPIRRGPSLHEPKQHRSRGQDSERSSSPGSVASMISACIQPLARRCCITNDLMIALASRLVFTTVVGP